MPDTKTRTFKHLTYTDRLRIEKWLKMGLKVVEIADKLRVNRRTIYHELKRGEFERLNGSTWLLEKSYSPDIAEQKYQQHLRDKGGDLKIGRDIKLAQFIEDTIIDKNYSPAAALQAAKDAGFITDLSATTIYSYIKKGVFLNLTQRDLPRHGKHKRTYKGIERKKAKRAPVGESIEKRPEEVNERREFGHWEGDTVYSGKKKSRAALLTMTERKTRKEIIIKIPNRQAESAVRAFDALERSYGEDNFRKVFKSITFDNGSEFAAADDIEKSSIIPDRQRTKVYYAHPYSSHERGTNEVQNGMIRRRYPKGTDFADITEEDICDTEKWMNDYPRKILNYSTSNKAFKAELRTLGISV